jgi:ABC-type lipoprotein export system ATPase subunit
MIEVNNLQYQYPNGKLISFPELKLEKGKHCLLLGESGTGKTTLLHLLGGLLRVQKGSVKIDNTDVSALSESQLDHFRGKNIGFIFQRNHLVSSLNVLENVMLAPYLSVTKIGRTHCEEVLIKLGMKDKLHTRIHELSQGQQQRVAIARALVNHPSIILADEPTSALDDKHSESVTQLLLNAVRDENATLIIATHDQRLKKYIHNEIKLKDY